MTGYGCTYLLITNPSHKINISFKQEKYSQGHKNIKNAPLNEQL